MSTKRLYEMVSISRMEICRPYKIRWIFKNLCWCLHCTYVCVSALCTSNFPWNSVCIFNMFFFCSSFPQPYLCESSYVLLEYCRTSMFMWMFIEGLYLHNVVTVTVFQGRFPHKFYSSLGWFLPAIMTIIWASFTAEYQKGLK